MLFARLLFLFDLLKRTKSGSISKDKAMKNAVSIKIQISLLLVLVVQVHLEFA